MVDVETTDSLALPEPPERLVPTVFEVTAAALDLQAALAELGHLE